MPSREPILATTETDDGVRITARYETPEVARLMRSLGALMAGSSFAVLVTLALWIINRAHLHDNGVWLLSIAGAIVAAMLMSRKLSAIFHARRFLRSLTYAHLGIDLDRIAITHNGLRYTRGGAIRFTAMPHRDGRIEERDERIKERLLSTTYRDAFQVWLQHGEAFTLLADVSDERAAAAIVRRLQEIDEQVTRGIADTNHNALFGARQVPG